MPTLFRVSKGLVGVVVAPNVEPRRPVVKVVARPLNERESRVILVLNPPAVQRCAVVEVEARLVAARGHIICYSAGTVIFKRAMLGVIIVAMPSHNIAVPRDRKSVV